jgi:hypothetical protein
MAPPPSAAKKAGMGPDMGSLSAMAQQLALARQQRVVQKAKTTGMAHRRTISFHICCCFAFGMYLTKNDIPHVCRIDSAG